MSADLLREAGEALYGPLWQSELARALEVSDRTVRRWAAGDTGIPAGVWPEIRDLAQSRRVLLANISRRLKGNP